MTKFKQHLLPGLITTSAQDMSSRVARAARGEHVFLKNDAGLLKIIVNTRNGLTAIVLALLLAGCASEGTSQNAAARGNKN